jgi:hypothetical protein
VCDACAPGLFLDSVGGSFCKGCEPGTWQPAPAATSCRQCAKGNYSNTGAEACTSCAAGQHQPVAGRPTCLLCPPGLYEGTTGSGANTCRFAHPHGVVRGACAWCSKHDWRLCFLRIAHSTSISLTHNTKRQHVYEMHTKILFNPTMHLSIFSVCGQLVCRGKVSVFGRTGFLHAVLRYINVDIRIKVQRPYTYVVYTGICTSLCMFSVFHLVFCFLKCCCGDALCFLAGKYQSASSGAITSCKACGDGEFSAAQAATCELCYAGQYVQFWFSRSVGEYFSESQIDEQISK